MEVRYLSKHCGVGISEALDLEKHFNEYGALVSGTEIGKPDTEALAQFIGTTEEEVEKLESICNMKKLLPEVPDGIQVPYDGFKPNFTHHDIPDCGMTLASIRALQRRSEDDKKKINKYILRYRGELNLDVDTAAMFYLGNDFYNDTRNQGNTDYSQTIREWGTAKGYMLGNMYRMEETTWCGVRGLRLGYPYLYMHQRFCEHLIVITDVRYLVIDNDRLPYKVANFCTICLTLFNYVNGIKTGSFQVYKYVDRASLI